MSYTKHFKQEALWPLGSFLSPECRTVGRVDEQFNPEYMTFSVQDITRSGATEISIHSVRHEGSQS